MGPTIYNSLNSKQQPMTIGDLVKNGVFSKAANRSADDLQQIDEHHWRPFFNGFQHEGVSHFEEYFFPLGLIKDPNLKKTDTFNSLLRRWAILDTPEAVIDDLKVEWKSFMDLKAGTSLMELPPNLKLRVQRHLRMKAPVTSLPFLMRLLGAFDRQTVSEADAIGIFDVVESFLVRRAVCGIEQNGLHAVFKRLWLGISDNICADEVTKVIRSDQHDTVQWPSDDEFRDNYANRKLYGSRITPYLLQEWDIKLFGDCPSDELTQEHVLPQNLVSEWSEYFSSSEMSSFTDVLANLLPLSGSGQQRTSNRPYKDKSQNTKGTQCIQALVILAKNMRFGILKI